MAKRRSAKKAKAKKTTKAKVAHAPKKEKKVRVIQLNPSAIRSTSKPRTKSEIMSAIADSTGATKKEVVVIVEALAKLIESDVGKRGPGQFTMPGLMKIVTVHKPATKARKGVNPFTGQEMMFKAKPSRNVIKVRPLKGLKDMVK